MKTAMGLFLTTLSMGVVPVQIMPLGDSITAGYFSGQGGYRKPLRELLEANGVHIDFVGRSTDRSGDFADPEHEGYSGYTISQIEAKAREALKQFAPKIILLFAGTNDIRVNGNNDDPSNPLYWKTTPKRFEALLQTIFEQAPNTVVITGALLPFEEKWAVREAAAREFNAALQKMVTRDRQAGRQIIYVDFRKYVGGKDLQDGLHPNAEGYRRIAQAWFDAMQANGLAGKKQTDAAQPSSGKDRP